MASGRTVAEFEAGSSAVSVVVHRPGPVPNKIACAERAARWHRRVWTQAARSALMPRSWPPLRGRTGVPCASSTSVTSRGSRSGSPGRCVDRQIVEEVVQDTFVAVWRSPDRYDGRGEVVAWMWGIAIHQLMHSLRPRKPLLDGLRSNDAFAITIGLCSTPIFPRGVTPAHRTTATHVRPSSQGSTRVRECSRVARRCR
jgi:Sigma-70 region 2